MATARRRGRGQDGGGAKVVRRRVGTGGGRIERAAAAVARRWCSEMGVARWRIQSPQWAAMRGGRSGDGGGV